MTNVALCMTSFGERLLDNHKLINDLHHLRDVSDASGRDLETVRLQMADNTEQLAKEIEMTEKSCGVRMGDASTITREVADRLRTGTGYNMIIGRANDARREMRYKTHINI